jgi:hypothetical protein
MGRGSFYVHNALLPTGQGEEMRARYSDTNGYIDRDGVKIYYEVYEEKR